MPGEACHTRVGEPVGYQEGVVWTRTFTPSGTAPVDTLRRYTATRGRLQEEGSLSLDGQLTINLPLLRPGPTVPHLTTSGSGEPVVAPRWNETRGLLELELLPQPPGGSQPLLGEHFLWTTVSSNSTAVWVYPRQSTR